MRHSDGRHVRIFEVIFEGVVEGISGDIPRGIPEGGRGIAPRNFL